MEGYNIEQCFFGLHLTKKYTDKGIAIVESEKTACLMSVLYPEYLWLACTALSHLQEFKFEPIKHREIILYPDLGVDKYGVTPYQKWSAKAKEYNSKGYNIQVSKVLEQISTKEGVDDGYDIADYFLINLNNRNDEHSAPARANNKELDFESVKKDGNKDFITVNSHTKEKDFSTVKTYTQEKTSSIYKGVPKYVSQDKDNIYFTVEVEKKDQSIKSKPKTTKVLSNDTETPVLPKAKSINLDEVERIINSGIKLPEKIELSEGVTITNVLLFLESHLSLIRSKPDSTYTPYANRLKEVVDFLISSQ